MAAMSFSLQDFTSLPSTIAAAGLGTKPLRTQRCKVLRLTPQTSAASETEYVFICVTRQCRICQVQNRPEANRFSNLCAMKNILRRLQLASDAVSGSSAFPTVHLFKPDFFRLVRDPTRSARKRHWNP